MIEFDCVDCHEHVCAAGFDKIPADQRCATCRWLVEHVPDETEREALRRRLWPRTTVVE